MPAYIPDGHLLIPDALDRLGRDLFQSRWTGEERKARNGLISKDRWLEIKDLPPARGSGASGGGKWARSTEAPVSKPAADVSNDPSDPLYQEEYEAMVRRQTAQGHFRHLLEVGQLRAVILDPWTGQLHRTSTSFWRRHDAGRMIERGQAPIPYSPNTGTLLVQTFAETNVSKKAMPRSKIVDAIVLLNAEIATKSLTRPQQKQFLRRHFMNFHVTERQFAEIFGAVAVPTGRPRKSDK
jgi:hypothetical protein